MSDAGDELRGRFVVQPIPPTMKRRESNLDPTTRALMALSDTLGAEAIAAEMRPWILGAYGIDETDPDWVAFNEAIGPAEDEAKRQREYFEQVVLPRRAAAALAEASRALPPGFELR